MKKKEEESYLKVCVDQNLTDEEREKADEIALELRPDNCSAIPFATLGDMNPSVPGQQRITVLKRYLWPIGQRLLIRFMDGDSSVQRKVTEVAEEWTNYANLSFNFINSGTADIRISFQQKGASWSYVGTQSRVVSQSNPTMNYGWLTPQTSDTEYRRVVLHEFGHALGAIHEHQNPAANIPWDTQAVYSYYSRTQGWSKAEIDNNVLKRYSTTETNYTQFDPKSIMLYAIPDELTIGSYSTGWNTTLSSKDKEFLAATYPRQAALTEMTVDGERVTADIGDSADTDVFPFTVPETGRYVMATGGATDVTMSLWGPDEETVLRAFDDNSGIGKNARIVRKLQPGTYWLKVQPAPSVTSGSYDVGVRRLSH